VKVLLESFTTQGCFYELDKDALTCTCPAFASDTHCKHLEALGCYKMRKATLSPRPSFSQALSALVKSIRLRDINEGAYWLNYCWQFKERLSGSHFRTVRRLLIGSAEDGHSVAVMEKLAENFAMLLGKDAEFERLMAELIRICKVPNWWHTDTGGPDYIYSGMLAQRRTLYENAAQTTGHCLDELEKAINQADQISALFWTIKAHESGSKAGLPLAEELLQIASHRNHGPAIRLMRNIYLRHAKSLTNDSNFTGQAAWLLAGGISPVIDQIEPVTLGDVRLLIERVNDTPPHPPPEWCCDGVHCAGNDIRYAGMWDRMNAVCNQFSHYGRVNPNDAWLEQAFYSLDGLRVGEVVNLDE
jgi:hypothetical protein